MAFDTFTALGVYPADGTITEFQIPDKFYDARDIQAYVVTDGVEVPLTPGADFSVMITTTEPTPPSKKSGYIKTILPPAGGNVVVFIWPHSDQDQPFEGRPVSPRQNERVHDRHAMRDASLRELFFRGFRAPLDAPPGLRYIVVGRPGRVPMYALDGSGSLVEGPTVEEVALVASIAPQVVTVAGISAQVSAVANVAAEVTVVSGIAPQVTTLAAVAPAIPIVAAIDDEVVIVAAIASKVVAVAAIDAQVAVVAANVTSVNTTAANIEAINTNAANIAAILGASAAANAAADSAAAAAASAASVDPATFKWVSKGIGELYAVETGTAGVDIPPTNNPNFRYIQLSAGAVYNTGVLTGETVSGSGNAVLATAVIALAGSPINGKTVRLLNAERRFIRAGVSGLIENSQNLSHGHTGTANSAGAHTHGIPTSQGGGSGGQISTSGGARVDVQTTSTGAHTHPLTIATDGGDEARPKNISMTHYMRIK